MTNQELFEELSNDYEHYIKKAVQHGDAAAMSATWYKNPENARSHARLAASHARRATEIENQLAIVMFRCWNERKAA